MPFPSHRILCAPLALVLAGCLNISAPAAGPPASVVPHFDTPEQAAAAFDDASWDGQLALIRPVTAAYIVAGRGAELQAWLRATPAPMGMEWRRNLLMSQYCLDTGDEISARQWIALIPAAARLDPLVLEFKLARPEISDTDPATLAALLAKSPSTQDTRRALFAQALDAFEPDRAMSIIYAHPEDLAAAPYRWMELMPRLKEDSMVSRLIPVLENQKNGQPANMPLRLTLAQFQLATGKNQAAQENLRAVYEQAAPPAQTGGAAQKSATQTTPPPPLIGLHSSYEIRASAVYVDSILAQFSPGPRQEWQRGRDLAVVELARLATDTHDPHDADAFLQRLDKTLPKDDHAERLTTFIMLKSPTLILGEIQSYLDSGAASPAVDDLAAMWLENSQPANPESVNIQCHRLLPAFTKRREDAARQSAAGPARGFANIQEFRKALDRAAAAHDPALVKQVYAAIDSLAATGAGSTLPALMVRAQRGHPGDDFYADAAAYALARCVRASIGDFPSLHTLVPPARWAGAQSPAHASATPLPIAGQAADAFLQHSTLNSDDGTAGRTNQDTSAHQDWVLKPDECAGLDRLAADPASPLKDEALAAKAYCLNFDPERRDEALRIMAAVAGRAPSDLLRFWLAGMLTRRGIYAPAAIQLDAIRPAPGNYTAFIQSARAVLVRAAGGKPLFDPAVPAATPLARPRDIRLQDLQAQVGALGNQKNPDAALAIANKVLRVNPFGGPENEQRTAFFKDCKNAGILMSVILRMQGAVNADPDNADGAIALAQAHEIDDPASAFRYYQQAFHLAPDRIDLAAKLFQLPPAANMDGMDLMPAYTLLFRHDPFATLKIEGTESLLARLEESSDFPAAMAAFATGSGPLGNWKDQDATFVRDVIAAYHKAGLDKSLPDLLTTLTKPTTWMREISGPRNVIPIDPVLDTMIANGMGGDAISIMTRLILPPAYRRGFDILPGKSLFLPAAGTYAPLDLIAKLAKMDAATNLEIDTRRILAKNADDPNAWEVLTAILTATGENASPAEFQQCVELIGLDTAPQFGATIKYLAVRAIDVPTTRSIGFNILDATQARGDHGNAPADLISLCVLCDAALNCGDRETAVKALREFTGIARDANAASTLLARDTWLPVIPLLLRAGMNDEAHALYKILLDQQAKQGGDALPPMTALDYMRRAEQPLHGDPAAASLAASDFQQILAASLAARQDYKGRPQELPVDMVRVFTTLGITGEAARALDAMSAAWIATNNQGFARNIVAARALLAQWTGETPPAAPAIFTAGIKGGQMDFWWNLGAVAAPGRKPGDQPFAVITPVDFKALDGRYAIDISGGPAPNRLVPLAHIPAAASRGEWHGPSDLDPGDIQFLRATLTGTGGTATATGTPAGNAPGPAASATPPGAAHVTPPATMPGGESITGPATSACIVENLLPDPDFETTLKGGKSPAAWTCSGILSRIPGPVPGRPGVEFAPHASDNGHIPPDVHGARIPVKQGDGFYLGGWLRHETGFSNIGYGCYCLDASGTVLQTNYCRGDGTGGWVFVEQRFLPAPVVEVDPETGEASPPPARRGGSPTLAPGTAFIEPFLGIDQVAAPAQIAGAPSQWAGLTAGVTPESARETVPPVPVFYQCDDGVQSFLITPDSKFLVAGSTGGAVRLVSYPDAKELSTLHAGDSPVTHLFPAPASGHFIAVDLRGGVYLAAFQPDSSIKLLYNSAIQSVLSATATSDARTIILAGLQPPKSAGDLNRPYPDSDIEVTSLDTSRKFTLTVPGYPRRLYFTPDGNTLVLEKTGTLSSAWQFPAFTRLPDIVSPPPPAPATRAQRRYALLHARAGSEPPPREDAQRKWKVAVEAGRITVRDLGNPARLIWTSPAIPPDPKALEIIPADGAILLLCADGAIHRYTVPDPAAPQS